MDCVVGRMKIIKDPQQITILRYDLKSVISRLISSLFLGGGSAVILLLTAKERAKIEYSFSDISFLIFLYLILVFCILWATLTILKSQTFRLRANGDKIEIITLFHKLTLNGEELEISWHNNRSFAWLILKHGNPPIQSLPYLEGKHSIAIPISSSLDAKEISSLIQQYYRNCKVLL